MRIEDLEIKELVTDLIRKDGIYKSDYGFIIVKNSSIEFRVKALFLISKSYLTEVDLEKDYHFCQISKDNKILKLKMLPQENYNLYLKKENENLTYLLLKDMLKESVLYEKG